MAPGALNEPRTPKLVVFQKFWHFGPLDSPRRLQDAPKRFPDGPGTASARTQTALGPRELQFSSSSDAPRQPPVGPQTLRGGPWTTASGRPQTARGRTQDPLRRPQDPPQTCLAGSQRPCMRRNRVCLTHTHRPHTRRNRGLGRSTEALLAPDPLERNPSLFLAVMAQ